MIKVRSPLLLKQLVFGKSADTHSAEDWALLLRQARAAGVISRLAFFQGKFGCFQVPDFVAPHLESAEKYWLSQKRIVDWELFLLRQAFEQLQLPIILLKGTAYLAADLNAGLGRVFSDIDILVPKQRLQEVKSALIWSGWFPSNWMTTIPAIMNAGCTNCRRCGICSAGRPWMRHNILPETCALCPDADLLLKAAVNIPGSRFWVLAPEDMVLHSASHLFWGGEFENGLRDLSDMDLLMREFSEKDGAFWQKLSARAEQLGLGKPLYYALRYTSKVLETPVPAELLLSSVVYGGGSLKTRFMDFLYLRALMPLHPSCLDRWAGLALVCCIFVRIICGCRYTCCCRIWRGRPGCA